LTAISTGGAQRGIFKNYQQNYGNTCTGQLLVVLLSLAEAPTKTPRTPPWQNYGNPIRFLCWGILPRRCTRLFGSVLRMSDSTHPTPLLSEHMTRLERIIIQSLEVIYFKTFSLIFTFVPSNPAYPYSENKMISNRSTCSENYAFFYSFTRASIAFYGLFLVVYIILLCIAAIRFFLSKRKSKALLRWWAFPVSIIFAILYVKPCHGSMSSCN